MVTWMTFLFVLMNLTKKVFLPPIEMEVLETMIFMDLLKPNQINRNKGLQEEGRDRQEVDDGKRTEDVGQAG